MIITAKKLLFITLIFFLVSSWLVASKETISKQLLLEKQAVSSYYKADWDGYFHSLFQLIQADISSELAQFYMLSLGLEKNLVKNYDNLYPFYAKVLSTMPEKLDYFTYHLVLEDLFKHYLKKGLTTEARELAKKSGTLDKWNVTGGFVHTYYNDIDHDFYNIEKSLTFTDGERYIWRELPYGSDWGWVPFNFLLYPDSVTTAYAGCYIFFPREGTYIFWLTSNSSAKIFLNNHLILKNDSRRESYEMNSLYEVNMKKGWYHLLVKSSPPGSMNNFRLKVLDHRGAPVQGLTLSLEPQSLMEHAPDGKKITPGIYEYFKKEIEKQPFQTMNYLRKAILDFHLFSVGQAKQTLLKATLIDKKDAFLKYFLGRFFYYDYSKHYKTSELEISKTLFKEALNINKDFLRAREFLSLCYFDLDQTDKTYENLGPLLFESKQNRAAQPLREATLPLSKYFHKIDWKLLEIDQLDRLYKESRKTEAGRLTADFYSDYDMDKASLIYENIFSLDHQEHPRQWFDILLEKKEYDKLENQLTLLRDISAYSAEYYLYLAELCLSRGDQKNALEILEQLYKIHPYPDVLNRIAQIHYDFGQKEKALEYFVQSYRIKPSDLDIKDKIDYIKNRTMHENLESEYYPLDPQPLIERAFKDSSLNGDIKYYLDLMVIKVHPDGTFRYEVHQIVKILNKNGKEKFGEITIPGSDNARIIRIGTFLSKDEFIEATDYKYHDNQRYISLPALKSGDVVDIHYQVNVTDSWLEHTFYFYYSPFLFQEKDGDLENSILVVVRNINEPAIQYSLRNEKDLKFFSKKKNNDLIMVWEKETSPMLEKEYHLPSLLDILPNIFLSSIPDWNVFSQWYYGKLQDRFCNDFSLQQHILSLHETSKTNYQFSKENFLKTAYYWIQDHILTFQSYLYYPQSVDEVFFKKEGSTEEKSILFKHMLDQINIPSFLVLVRNNNYSELEYKTPSPNSFDSVLVYVPLQGKDIFIDFSEKHIPFGFINFPYVTEKGFLIEKDGSNRFINIRPVSNHNVIHENFTLAIRSNGFQIKGDIIHKGNFNLAKKIYSDPTTSQSAVLERINSVYDGMIIHDYSLIHTDDLKNDLEIKFDGTIPFETQEAEVDLMMDKLKLKERFISQSRRTYPLRIYHPIIKEFYTLVDLNDLKIKQKPEPVNIEYKFGQYSMRVDNKKNKLLIIRKIKIMPSTIEPSRYKEFTDFCTEVDRAENEKFIFFF